MVFKRFWQLILMPRIRPKSEETQARTREKLLSLKDGDFLYLHPRNPTEYLQSTAYFAQYKSPPLQENTETIIFHSDVTFSYERKARSNGIAVGVWFPELLRMDYSFSLPRYNIIREMELYVNDDIQQGMAENGNPNYGLVKAIMDELKKRKRERKKRFK
jgi:hypothetical protein